jgi:zinc/manganese transport system permease protein
LIIALIAWKIYPKTVGIGREILFFTLLSITVTSSVQLAGVLVVFVLLIAPILVASMQKRFPHYPFALIFGGSLSILSMILSYYADLPTGYTMVFLIALISLGTLLVLSTKKSLKVL